jgi:BirA family biotin operon repressor/biotin-[acetyl-CoA-carboxylase] ligase
MNIIKLDAIDSTNSFIKKLAENKPLKSFTVVQAKHQFAGQGQQGAPWISPVGKNLTFSILVKLNSFEISNQFYLSMAVSLGIITELNKLINTTFYIKWPNDILAGRDKIAGILIENIVGSGTIKRSIIGIGLNVNQVVFSKGQENATSLKIISERDFDLEVLLESIVTSIKYFVDYIKRKDFKNLKEEYINFLFKFGVPSMFEDAIGKVFMGRIINVSEKGELEIELENETICKFNLKEIKFVNNFNN